MEVCSDRYRNKVNACELALDALGLYGQKSVGWHYLVFAVLRFKTTSTKTPVLAKKCRVSRKGAAAAVGTEEGSLGLRAKSDPISLTTHNQSSHSWTGTSTRVRLHIGRRPTIQHTLEITQAPIARIIRSMLPWQGQVVSSPASMDAD